MLAKDVPKDHGTERLLCASVVQSKWENYYSNRSQSMMWWTVVVEVYDLPQIDAAGNTTTKFSHVFASM